MSAEEMKAKSRQRMNGRQLDTLVQYMVGHSVFAKSGLCPGVNGKAKADKMWEELAVELNAYGPPKSVSGWKQTWSDYKFRTKRKAASINNQPTGNVGAADNGNGNAPVSLTENETATFHLYGCSSWTGEGEDEEVGPKRKKVDEASAATDNDASTSINLEVIDATSAADLIDGAYFVIDDPTNNIFLPNLPENPAMPQAQDSQDAQDAQDVPQAASLNESKSKKGKGSSKGAGASSAGVDAVTEKYIQICQDMTSTFQQGIEALKQHTAAIQQLSTEAAKLSAAFGKFSDGVL